MDWMRWRSVMGGAGMLAMLAACGGDGGGSDRAGQAEQDAAPTTTAPTTTAPTTTTTTAPRVVYEIDGIGTVLVNYSISGDRMQNREVTLPWSEEQADDPSRLSMLATLVGSEGDITCRIRKGTEILAEATLSATAGPLLACDYPPSGLPPVTFP